MAHKLYQVVAFEYLGDYTLWVKLNDGFARKIDFDPVLYGEMFGPLRDIRLFSQVRLNDENYNLVWPNGADFDPETLRHWDATKMAKLGQQWAAASSLDMLPSEDGEPLESNKHRAQGSLLIELMQQSRGNRKDYYAAANMYVYYSAAQAEESKRTGGCSRYRGPDFFVVLDVDGSYDRESWIVWHEGGRYPNIIVEFLSESTAETDKTSKKLLYATTFRTQNYFYFDPYTNELTGFTLVGNVYQDLKPNERGWLWCNELGWWLGLWTGEYQGHTHTWLRFFTADGQLIPTKAEAEHQRAEAERQRAEAERQRAEAERQQAELERQRAEAERQRAASAEAELARLRALLQAKGIDLDRQP